MNDEIQKLEEFLEKNPKKNLIFDFDETICHLILPWNWYIAHLHKLIAQYDLTLIQQWDRDIAMLENAAVKRYGPELKHKIVDLALDFERGHLKRVDPNPELIAWIQKEHANYVLSIWSSNTSVAIQGAMQSIGLNPGWFKHTLAKDTVTYIKQDPEGFSHIFEPDKEFKKDYLMIGDKENRDKLAAKNAGIDYFQINYFKNP